MNTSRPRRRDRSWFPILLVVASSFSGGETARGEWIWSSDSGWVNTDYAGRKAFGPLLAEARADFDARRFDEAAAAFESMLEAAPTGKMLEDALFYAGEARYELRELSAAHTHYERLLDEFPATNRLRLVAEREYRIGQAFVRGEGGGSGDEGVRILRRVVEIYPTGDFADDARFAIANYYYDEGSYLEAMEEYKILREDEDYKKSEWREVALYKIALCQEAPFQGPRYDTSPIEEALASYEAYEGEVSEEYRAASQERRKEIEEELARSDLARAKWYLQWDRPTAASIYLREILDLYPSTATAGEAREMLSDIGGGD